MNGTRLQPFLPNFSKHIMDELHFGGHIFSSSSVEFMCGRVLTMHPTLLVCAADPNENNHPGVATICDSQHRPWPICPGEGRRVLLDGSINWCRSRQSDNRGSCAQHHSPLGNAYTSAIRA